MTLRVCLYARYSTDLQNDKSNEDQLRELHGFLPKLAAMLSADVVVVLIEQDAAQSGATIHRRAGLRRVRRAASEGAFDLLLTETPNRLARKVGEMGVLHDELRYERVRWFTVTMGEMDPMKVGMMGAASQQTLEEGKHFTRRGLRACIEDGRAAGGLSFGYTLDRTKTHYDNKRGQQVITRGLLVRDEAHAALIVRIFRLYLAGLSSKAIARLLNSEGLRGPRGRVWRPSTIHGNQQTGVGILNNELYIGRLVHGRREYRINPATGSRGKAIMNSADSLTITDVPHLRIVPDDLWLAVKARQAATKRAQRTGLDKARRPKFLFSKLTTCGVCGGGFTTESRRELRCHNYRAAGPSVCTNSRFLTVADVERRVLVALQDRFLTPERLEAFSREYVSETNRLHAEQQSTVTSARHELDGIDRRQMQILGYLNGGFGEVEVWKVEVRQNELRRAQLQATLTAAASAPPPAPALHPHMAAVFEHKIRQLAAALAHEDIELRESARSTLRGFIDQIVIPREGLLHVVGRLGEMLTVAGGHTATVGNGRCGGGI